MIEYDRSKFVRSGEACRLLGSPTSRLWALARKGELIPTRVSEKKTLWSRDSILRLVRADKALAARIKEAA